MMPPGILYGSGWSARLASKVAKLSMFAARRVAARAVARLPGSTYPCGLGAAGGNVNRSFDGDGPANQRSDHVEQTGECKPEMYSAGSRRLRSAAGRNRNGRGAARRRVPE